MFLFQILQLQKERAELSVLYSFNTYVTPMTCKKTQIGLILNGFHAAFIPSLTVF